MDPGHTHSHAPGQTGRVLLLSMALTLAFVVARGRSSDARAGWAAIALMIFIFVSPLCALSSALFSARVLGLVK